jgi:hypothetical protein
MDSTLDDTRPFWSGMFDRVFGAVLESGYSSGNPPLYSNAAEIIASRRERRKPGFTGG